MKKILLVSVLALAGCSGLNYAIENYKGVEFIRYNHKGQTFRIFDKPNENRLMITPTLGASMAQGATYGLAATAQRTYQDASLAYLETTGRSCKATDVALIVTPQWEVFYEC